MSVQDPAIAKALYRVRNWSDYNQSLVGRGKITLWLDSASIKTMVSTKTRNCRGRPDEFSASTFECCLIIRSLFRQPLQETQGSVEGMIHILGLDLSAPHDTLLWKKPGNLKNESQFAGHSSQEWSL